MPDSAHPILHTPRLQLRPRSAADAEALLPAMADTELMTYWSRAPFTSLDELADYFTPDPASPWHSWAVTTAQDHHAIGFVSAGPKRPGVTEIGYFLGRSAQGQGFAAEAVSALITHLFTTGNHRLFADTDPDNRGSIALLTRLGFRQEGHLRHEWQTHIGLRDSLIFGLLASEWPAKAS